MPKKPNLPESARVSYLYARVSSEEQKRSGLSIENQKDEYRRHYEYKLAPEGITDGGCFVEEAESAWKKPFLKRPKGAELHKRLRRGDIVVITKLNRAFRNTKDAIAMRDLWESMGVSLVILDLQIDTSTAAGKLTFTMLASISQFDSDNKAEATTAALNARRKRLLAQQLTKLLKEGRITPEVKKAFEAKNPTEEDFKLRESAAGLINTRPSGKAQPPLGMKFVGKPGRKEYAVDEKMIGVLADMWKWRYEDGTSVERIARRLIREGIPNHYGQAWSHGGICRALKAYRVFQLHEAGSCGGIRCFWCEYKPKREEKNG